MPTSRRTDAGQSRGRKRKERGKEERKGPSEKKRDRIAGEKGKSQKKIKREGRSTSSYIPPGGKYQKKDDED